MSGSSSSSDEGTDGGVAMEADHKRSRWWCEQVVVCAEGPERKKGGRRDKRNSGGRNRNDIGKRGRRLEKRSGEEAGDKRPEPEPEMSRRRR